MQIAVWLRNTVVCPASSIGESKGFKDGSNHLCMVYSNDWLPAIKWGLISSIDPAIEGQRRTANSTLPATGSSTFHFFIVWLLQMDLLPILFMGGLQTGDTEFVRQGEYLPASLFSKISRIGKLGSKTKELENGWNGLFKLQGSKVKEEEEFVSG